MSELDRRGFLKGSAASMAGAAFSVGAPLKKDAASDRVQVGCVGVGGRAGFLVKTFAGLPAVDVVGLADIDSNRLTEAVETVKGISGKAPRRYRDFRRLVEDPQIDALVVGTPDHWHSIPTIMGCIAGKDVYVEKPDGHNMLEGQRMVQAMRKHQRIVQMGTQARTGAHFLSAIRYIRSGKLGKVLVAKAWESSRQRSIGRPADSDPPEGVDYDMWLGAAPKRPFNVKRFHGNWRWFFDYGTGDLGNDGVHRLDYALWALSAAGEAQGEDPLSIPTKVSAIGGKWYFDDMQEWPDTLQVNYEYGGEEGKPGRILTYEMRVWTPYDQEGVSEGAAIYGDQGLMIIGNRGWHAFGPDRELLAKESGSIRGVEHIQNFIDCVKSRKKPNADLETVGHPSSILCHAGNLAWRLGRQVELDLQTETFVGDEEANALRTRPEYRAPWTLPTV